MAVIHGSTGSAVFSDGGAGTLYEELFNVFRWSANIVNDEYDDTDFETGHEGKSAYMGMYTVRGSCTAFLDGTEGVQSESWAAGRAAVALVLTSSTGRAITLNAKADNFGHLVNKGTGLNALTFDFVGEGDITSFA